MADGTQSQTPTTLEKIVKMTGGSSMNEALPQNGTPNIVESDFKDPTASMELGDLCQVKVLYEGPAKCQCCINWVDNEPEDLKKAIEEQAENKKHALLIRMKKNHGEGKPLVLDSIVVQNKYLKELLGRVFSGYSGITTTLKKLVFRQPFCEFLYEWKRFNELCESETMSEERKLGRLLHDVLASELEETFSQSEDLVANNVITFDYLWTIFKPGIDVYSSQSGRDCVYNLVKTGYGNICTKPCFQLEVQSIHCNGQEFGWKTTWLVIWAFSGTKTFAQLEAIPLPLHPQSQVLKAKAEARGKAARDYQTVAYHYATYRGTAVDKDDQMFNINGRIMIDAAAYELFNFHHRLNLRPLNSCSLAGTIDVSDKNQDHQPQVYESYNCFRLPAAENAHGKESQLEKVHRKDQVLLPSLDDAFLYLCSPEVRGYCLQTKKWATFDVDKISPIRWNETAFQNLVISEDCKRLILAFVESQIASKEEFDDLIQGKGRGLIMLLEGSPGVGKTLTAEAIADRVKRPLYTISGGQIGEDASALEQRLPIILEIATKWNAVLLLDECDVFLEKRSINNLHRNSIVAVLLRLIEYYQGILFMTTNRVNAIDPAFQSRIHLTIEYPKLNQEARQHVWTHFLRTQCPDACILDKEIQELAKTDMNGREIKNTVKTARLLAKHGDNVMTAEQIRTVMRVFKKKPFAELVDERVVVNGDGEV